MYKDCKKYCSYCGFANSFEIVQKHWKWTEWKTAVPCTDPRTGQMHGAYERTQQSRGNNPCHAPGRCRCSAGSWAASEWLICSSLVLKSNNKLFPALIVQISGPSTASSKSSQMCNLFIFVCLCGRLSHNLVLKGALGSIVFPQVISDFDMTLTRFAHNGNRVPTTHSKRFKHCHCHLDSHLFTCAPPNPNLNLALQTFSITGCWSMKIAPRR